MADNWRPLISIADTFGWGEQARAARSPALGSDVVALGYGALGLTRMVGMRRAQELFLLGVFRAAGDNDRVLFGVEEHAANGAEGARRTVG
jgi:1,4-dihydroxy-2-naphthoyl-CoA synthase